MALLDQERAEVERHDQNGNLILGRGRKGCWKGLQHCVMWALIVKVLVLRWEQSQREQLLAFKILSQEYG